MELLQDWLRSPEVQRLRKLPLKELLEKEFNREPFNPIYSNCNIFYSPASGVILYAKEVELDRGIISIKGKELTIEELLKSKMPKGKYLVIGIFMTIYDVHINKMPTSGFINSQRIEPLRIENIPMIKLEQTICGGFDKLSDWSNYMEYLFYNERVINRIYNSDYNLTYYIVQIADMEVNVISQFYKNDMFLPQGINFSQVRLGSQVDLIIPIKDNLDYINLVKDKIGYHIEAGEDVLIEIHQKV